MPPPLPEFAALPLLEPLPTCPPELLLLPVPVSQSCRYYRRRGRYSQLIAVVGGAIAAITLTGAVTSQKGNPCDVIVMARHRFAVHGVFP